MLVRLKKNNETEKEISDFNEIKSLLKSLKINADQIKMDKNGNFIEDYNLFVENFKKENNYISNDEVKLSPSTPEEILNPFKSTHHHLDDEIRFTIDGEGIFGIVKNEGEETEILCSKGDLISIPAYTRHWFKLTEKKSMQCVRIFKENPKWEAIYEAPEKTAS